MVVKLSDELRAALQHQPGQPLTIEDDRTRQSYVLIPAEVFQQVRSILYDEDDFDIAETYAAQSAVAGSAGWDDPEMDVYDEIGRDAP
jgi:hypothetical protein